MKYLKLYESFLSKRSVKDFLKENNIKNDVTELNCYSNQIESLKGVENLTNLTGLDCYSNQIESLKGVENLTNLTWLHCYSNQIESLKGVENLTNLTWLHCYDNPIKYPVELPNENLIIKDVYGEELVNKFKSYDFQREFLTNNPDKFKALEPFGYAEGIKEEFPALFTGKEWGFFDLERDSR